MILDLLKNRFAIVAHQGNSAAYAPNSPRALISAVPFADILMADITLSNDAVPMCSDRAPISTMTAEEAEDKDVVPLEVLVEWAQASDKHLILNPRTNNTLTLLKISDVARAMAAEDNISVVARTLAYTGYARAFNDKLGIVGMLKSPDLYARFYEKGGHVATLAQDEATPLNIRKAEAAAGARRHPFLILSPEAQIRDVYKACNGQTGAAGIVMKNPEAGHEALTSKASRGPAFRGFYPD